MHRFISRLVPLVALSLIVSGCNNSSSSSDTVVTPAAATVTESFTGTLTLNGATTFSFTVTGIGNITARLTTLRPDATRPVGLGLGTWNGSSCQIVLPNDASVEGSVIVGSSSTTGSFCVRIYDAAGTVVQQQTYTIEVTHQ